MYIHIGQNFMIKKKYIVGIFDIETTTGSVLTKNFLAKAQKNMEIVSVSQELPRSYILYNEDGKKQVYLTQLSCSTLQKRNEEKNDIIN